MGMLEVEVEFKEEDEGRTGGSGNVLEVEVEFMEEEEVEQVDSGGAWRSKWSSRRKRRKNR